jgi:hypothetical protein
MLTKNILRPTPSDLKDYGVKIIANTITDAELSALYDKHFFYVTTNNQELKHLVEWLIQYMDTDQLYHLCVRLMRLEAKEQGYENFLRNKTLAKEVLSALMSQIGFTQSIYEKFTSCESATDFLCGQLDIPGELCSLFRLTYEQFPEITGVNKNTLLQNIIHPLITSNIINAMAMLDIEPRKAQAIITQLTTVIRSNESNAYSQCISTIDKQISDCPVDYTREIKKSHQQIEIDCMMLRRDARLLENPERQNASMLSQAVVLKLSQPKIAVDRAASTVKAFVKDAKNYNIIIPQLYLGQFPTAEDAKNLQEETRQTGYPLGLVVSVVNPAEFVSDRQNPSDWAERGVEHFLVRATDHDPRIDIEMMCDAARRIESAFEEGKSVLVHCKGGQSRSAEIVLLVLATIKANEMVSEKRYNLTHIIQYMEEKRNMVDLRPDHRKNVEAAIALFIQQDFKAKDSYQIEKKLSVKENLDKCFSNLYFKKSIFQLCSVKMLQIYAAKKNDNDRLEIVNSFMNTIISALDATWFLDLLTGRGDMKVLIDYCPQGESVLAQALRFNQPNERHLLSESLRSELIELVANETGYTKQEIQDAVLSRPSSFNHVPRSAEVERRIQELNLPRRHSIHFQQRVEHVENVANDNNKPNVEKRMSGGH